MDDAAQIPNPDVRDLRAGLHLDDQSRRVHPQDSPACDDIDPPICARRRHGAHESLGLQDCGHQQSQLVSGELLGDAGRDAIPGHFNDVGVKLRFVNVIV